MLCCKHTQDNEKGCVTDKNLTYWILNSGWKLNEKLIFPSVYCFQFPHCKKKMLMQRFNISNHAGGVISKKQYRAWSMAATHKQLLTCLLWNSLQTFTGLILLVYVKHWTFPVVQLYGYHFWSFMKSTERFVIKFSSNFHTSYTNTLWQEWSFMILLNCTRQTIERFLELLEEPTCLLFWGGFFACRDSNRNWKGVWFLQPLRFFLTLSAGA